MAIATVNPATGETIRTFEPLTDAALDERLALAGAAFHRWRG
jgi:succinate-semialdehyde dehydrogenase / glutarate-semialdehyde dehydrogenase